MKPLPAILALLVLVVAAAMAFPPQRDVLSAIDIAAPPERVWAILTDTASYPAWNKGMVLKGKLAPAQTIEYDQGEGSGRMVFHPTVVVAAEPSALSWRGQIGAPFILEAVHSFRLQPEGEHTLFKQSEHLRGVLLYLFDASQLLPQFQAMNAHLKARAEQSFPLAPPPTTSRR